MLDPRRPFELLVLMSEPVLTVAKRVVDAPPLNLGVTGVARLDQVIRRSARRPLEIVDPALKRACAAVGLPFDPACPQKLVQLPVLVAGNMVATGPIRKARVLLRVGSHAVQRIPEAVVVLGLDVHAVHPVVHRAGAWNPVGRRNRRAAVEYIPGPAHAHMDPARRSRRAWWPPCRGCSPAIPRSRGRPASPAWRREKPDPAPGAHRRARRLHSLRPDGPKLR